MLNRFITQDEKAFFKNIFEAIIMQLYFTVCEMI